MLPKIITTEIFLQKAREIHGQKYDYSKTVYVSAKDKVCIVCPVHGEFLQAPDKHLHGRGCPRCARPNSNLSQEEFIVENFADLVRWQLQNFPII